jgi:hypothetical protein
MAAPGVHRLSEVEDAVAVINIKKSQAVVDLEHQPGFGNGPVGSLADVLDGLAAAKYAISQYYQNFSSWSLPGSTLTLNFQDGATTVYTGVVRADPQALKGTATATNYEFHKPEITVSEHGSFAMNYELAAVAGGYALSLAAGSKPSSISSWKMDIALPVSNPNYYPAIGNPSFAVNSFSHLAFDAAGNINGQVSNLSVATDQMVRSISIDGRFDISGNIVAIGQGSASMAAAGTMSAYTEDFRDGSHAWLSGLSTELTSTQVIDMRLLSEAARFGGDDVIDLDLPAKLYEDFLMASGAGNDVIALRGGGGRLNVDAGSGNDKISIQSDAHKIDGGAGVDTVAMPLARASYTVQRTDDGLTVKDSLGVTSTLVNVERISFSDANFAFDVAGNGGQIFRTYQAAFNRAPDSGGLGFWLHFMDAGMTLPQVAAGFMAAPEFKDMYGADPSHLDFVSKLYMNVLHRQGEASGIKFWMDALEHPEITYAGVLAAFAESAENQAALIGVISNGFSYTPFGG